MQGSFYPFQQYIDDLSKTQDGSYKMYPSKYLIAPTKPADINDFLSAVNERMSVMSYKDKRNYSASEIVQRLTDQSGTPTNDNKFVGADINFLGSDVFDGKTYFETYLHFPQPSQAVAYSAVQTYENHWKKQVIYSYEPLIGIDSTSEEYQSDSWDPDKIEFREWINGSFIKYPQMYAYTREKTDGVWGELNCIAQNEQQNDDPIWTPLWNPITTAVHVRLVWNTTRRVFSSFDPDHVTEWIIDNNLIEVTGTDDSTTSPQTSLYIDINGTNALNFFFIYQLEYSDGSVSDWRCSRKYTQDDITNIQYDENFNEIYLGQTNNTGCIANYDVPARVDTPYDSTNHYYTPSINANGLSTLSLELAMTGVSYFNDTIEISIHHGTDTQPADLGLLMRQFKCKFFYLLEDTETDAIQITSDELPNQQLSENWVPPASFGPWEYYAGPILNQTNKQNIWFFCIYQAPGRNWTYVKDTHGSSVIWSGGVSSDFEIKIGQAKPSNNGPVSGASWYQEVCTLNIDTSKYPNVQVEANIASGIDKNDYDSRLFNIFNDIFRMVNGTQRYALFYGTTNSSIPTNPDNITRQNDGAYKATGWSQEPGGYSNNLITWPTEQAKFCNLAIYDVSADPAAWLGDDFPTTLVQAVAVNGFAGNDLPANRPLFTDPTSAPSTISIPAVILFYNLYTTGGTVVCRDMPLGIFVLDSAATVNDGESWSTRIATRFAYSGNISANISTSGNTFNTLQRLLESFGDTISAMNEIAEANRNDINDFKAALDTIKRSGAVNVPYLLGDIWYVNGHPAKNLLNE